jgi:catechol 2,3-dioxygenase-like lactoylglutathione lyase family enzyme
LRARVLCIELTWKTVAWTQNGSSENEKEHVMKFINVRLLVSDITVELLTREGFAAALGEAPSTPAPEGRPAVLVFRVDDVDTAYADFVERGATAVAGPQDRPAWQVRSAHLSDPDGYLVEIYSQLPGADAPTA